MNSELEQRLITKIRQLPECRILEIEDFVDFLARRTVDKSLVQALGKLSESSFAKVWDNDEDSVYDQL